MTNHGFSLPIIALLPGSAVDATEDGSGKTSLATLRARFTDARDGQEPGAL